ncbi:hypothetical protein [Streptomyces sp. NPDC017260]|uniref:hypothetical protein n=1 Tax=unclassified Streptomyces TaxID=2593676 RepID=UPI0037A74DA4
MGNRPMAYSTIMAMQSANSREFTGALAALAGRNLKSKRRRQQRETAARIAHANLRPAPGTLGESKRPCDVPVTFKAAKPERRRVTRAATSTAPEPVKASEPKITEFQPIKAAELPKNLRDAAKPVLAGKFCENADTAGWLLVDTWERDGKPVNVYVRRYGKSSARYSTMDH